jgi:nitric oxide reductase subunit C
LSKISIFISLFAVYIAYSFIVYTKGTEKNMLYSPAELENIDRGKKLFQQHNCISCHQLYGLGGYLGPELTTAWSDPYRGEAYMKAFLKNGGLRMPKYNFNDDEINAIISYLRYVDSTAVTYKKPKP